MMLLTVKATLIGAGIFYLPGQALLVLLKPRLKLDPIERFSLALGLSLAAIPLSLYGMTLAGLHQTASALWILLLVCGLITIWGLWRSLRDGQLIDLKSHRTTLLAFAVIFVGALLARLLGVSGLDFPLWTDSYHHTLVAQIIADTGQVPSSYEPYAPIHSFTYHFGFHTLVAWFNLLTGIPVPRSVVLVGQIVNALVVPTTYLLAKRLWGNTSIALSAGLIVGLLSHMPAQFVNWGRYTQLTGQILMPVVLSLYLILLDTKERSWPLISLCALSAAGLFLAHNRITLFLIVFGALFFIHSILEKRGSPAQIKTLVVNTLLVALIAILVAFSWLITFAQGFGRQVADTLVNGYDAEVYGQYFSWDWRYLPEFGARVWMLFLAAAGILIGAKRRDRNTLILALGTITLLALSFTNTIGFTPLFSALIVAIWMYLPLGLLSAYSIETMYAWLSVRWIVASLNRRYLLIPIVPILILAYVTGARSVKEITLPENGFVRDEDLLAMSWIRENTEHDALFYVSTHFWTPIVAHGLDAGYWIPYLADRQTTLPPQMYASDGSAEYMAMINTRARELIHASSISDAHNLMVNYGITHVYIGNRPSSLSAQEFLQHADLFELLYNDGQVWIFRVIS